MTGTRGRRVLRSTGFERHCHMMSTKNSQGLPIACWKDWRLAVSSGGTAANSLPGGAPGGVLLLTEVLGASRARQ